MQDNGRIPNLPVVLVDWVDSQHTGGWTPLEDLREHVRDAKRLECRTVGFLLADHPERIVVAASLGDDQAADGTMIPRCAIRSVRRLSAGKGK